MWSLIKIYNKNYWKSIFAPILTFVIPILVPMLFICTFNLQISKDSNLIIGPCIVPSVIFLTLWILSILILPQSIHELKNSIFAKQLVASSIKPWEIPVGGILFYAMFDIVTVAMSMFSVYLSGLFMIHCREQMFWIFTQIDWGEFIYVIFINLLTALSFGAMLGLVCKNVSTISLISTLLIFLSLVLAGFIAPIVISPSQHPALWTVSYFDFIRYPVTSAFEAIYGHASTYNVNGSSLFDFSTPYKAEIMSVAAYPFEILKPVDKLLNMTIPYLVFAISISSVLLKKRG